MDENEEYERLLNEKRSTQDDLEDAYVRRDWAQEKIDRLKVVKRTLYDCCDSFQDVKGAVRKELRGSFAWKGTQFENFSFDALELMSANDSYYDSMDGARDAINSEITRLENEVYRQEGIIGHLRAALNSLLNKIENFFN